jgi:hypothetical protein
MDTKLIVIAILSFCVCFMIGYTGVFNLMMP